MKEFLRLLPAAVTQGDVTKVVRAILSEPNPWDWFSRARIPFPHAVAILRALRDGGYLEFESTRLTPRGQQLAKEIGALWVPDLECTQCRGSGTDWSNLDETFSRYLEVYRARPRGEDRSFDQGAMTPESLFRRIALMISEGDVSGRSIVALGDDDLASLALALTRLPREITVLEIDSRICDYIDLIARQQGLPIRVQKQDLAACLPEALLGSFDTFVCDPPETETGLTLFVEKGLALLRSGDGRAGYFGATVLEASLEKWRRWQVRLLNHPVAFTHILPPFTEYESWPDEKPLADIPPLATLSPRPWYRFAFYRLETLPQFRSIPDFQVEHTDLFYFDEESYYEAFK